MKVLVGIQRVLDYKAQIRVKADQTGIDTTNIKMIMNPFDEIAVEEAVRLKEKNLVSEVVVVSIGTEACHEILRTALALGADRALLVKTDEPIQSLAAAKILQAIARRETPQLIILGKQAIDNDNNQTGQLLAGLLGWAQGTFASRLVVADRPNTPPFTHLHVTREIDGGLEELTLTLPVVITTDLRLNEPRHISLPNIMQAKRKTLDVLALEELRVDTVSRLQIVTVSPPAPRPAGVLVKNVADLISKLRDEARIL